MVTASATMCYCGVGLQYIGPNKDTLHCPHCDRGCRVQQTTGQPCVRCEMRDVHWRKQIRETY